MRRSATVADPGSRRGQYVLVLLFGRAADSATTLYGLAQPGVYERNPVVASLIGTYGPELGLLVANALAVGLVVLAAEAGLRTCRRSGVEDGLAAAVVAVCYLPFAVVSFAAALYNLGVIAVA